ncbi:helicase conserved C-terminal domain [Bordetella phage PY223]
MISLRPYQQIAVDALRASFRAGKRAPLFQLPTGGGKTFVFSYVADGATKLRNRVLILVHRKELLTQASMSLAKIGLRHSLIAQDKHIREAIGLHVEELSAPFVDLAAPVAVASVDTLIRRLGSITAPQLIICDEAHHLTKGNKWGKAVAHFPDARLLGVTATPVRTDGKGLGVAADGYFDDLICGPSMRELIGMGFLLPPTVYAPPSVLDLTGVRTSGGDYATADLAARVDKPTITGDAVEHYRRICPYVPAIVFCVSIAHAEHVAAQFRASGFDFRVIHGGMHDAERRNLIRALARGQIHGLTSCDIISEGTDIPVVGCGILLRPTKSEGLYLQQVGRVLRPSPGQERAYILDHVGNCLIHGLPDADREWTLEGRKKRKKGEAKEEPTYKVLQCEKCNAASSIEDAKAAAQQRGHPPGVLCCKECGAVFESDARQVDQQDGELVAVEGEAAEALRRTRKAEERRATTYDDFVELGKARGYDKPEAWARIRMKFKQRREPMHF